MPIADDPGVPPATIVARLARLAAKVPTRPTALALATVIAVLVAFGIAQRTAYPEWRAANLDHEASVATVFSASLLWAAAVAWLLVAATARSGSRSLWVWAVLLVWLALDEGNAFHEKLERWSGIDWQLLYLPIGVVGASAWWGLVRRFWTAQLVPVLLWTGAGAWAVALLLELIQNWGGPPVAAEIYNPTMIVEEALEMVGSSLFLFAGLRILREGEEPAVVNDDRGATGGVARARAVAPRRR